MANIQSEILEKSLKSIESDMSRNETLHDDFPYSIFSKEIQQYIDECEVCLGYPKQYTVASILLATSLAIGNTRKIFLMPGFEDMANIFILLLGPPSANKTRSLKNCIKYFQELDAWHHKETKKELLRHAQDVKNGKDVGEAPQHRNFILDDVTPESIMGELERNNWSVGIVADEMDQALNAGKYNGSANMEPFYNTFWSREIRKVTRATKSQILVHNPFLSMIGATQTSRAGELFRGRESSGFAHRFCYIILDKVPINKWGRNRGVPELNFDIIIKKIHESLGFDQNEYGEDIPGVVHISSDGADHIIQWQNALREKAEKEDDYFQSAVGKMESYALRYTLILHYLKWAITPGTDEFRVDVETCKNATKLADFFLDQSIKFQQLVYSNDSYADSLPLNKRKLYDALPQSFQRIEAIDLAPNFDISSRATDTFLKDAKLFKKAKHGNYEKLH